MRIGLLWLIFLEELYHSQFDSFWDVVSEYSNIGMQYDGIWLTVRCNCFNDEKQFQHAPIQLLTVRFEMNFFPDCTRPCKRSLKESSLWLYSCLVKCFSFFFFKYFMFDEMEDQKCMILKMFYSDILELLILFKNTFYWKGSFTFHFQCGSENPDSFDVSVHVWITHA